MENEGELVESDAWGARDAWEPSARLLGGTEGTLAHFQIVTQGSLALQEKAPIRSAPVKPIAFITMAIACVVMNAAIGAPAPHLPSERLSAFLRANLDTIVAPFGGPGYGNPQALIDLRESFADGMATAPDAGQPAYRAAMDVCEVLARAISEREDAVARLSGGSTVHTGSDLGGIRRSNLKGWDGWVEDQREKREKKEREQVAARTDSFFTAAAQVQWKQRTVQLRQMVLESYQRERQAERDVNLPGLLAAAAAVANPPTAAASASAASPAPAVPPAPGAWDAKEFYARICSSVWSWEPFRKKRSTLYFDASGWAFDDDWVASWEVTDVNTIVIHAGRMNATMYIKPNDTYNGTDFDGHRGISGKRLK